MWKLSSQNKINNKLALRKVGSIDLFSSKKGSGCIKEQITWGGDLVFAYNRHSAGISVNPDEYR